MTGALATHYARALADAVFAPHSGLDPRDAVAQLRESDSLISGSKDLELALLSPAVPTTRKKAVISRLSDELGLHRLLRNFLLVVASHRRTKELADIRKEFEAVVDERLGWIPAEITSAKELNPEQRGEIEQTLGARYGKRIRAHYKVDPSLLAGARVQIASKEYDATLRGRLESMRQRLVGHV
jgi:F-type H+-transporting ATPase subunit delta